jgi:CHAD domain-containing protein
MKSVMQHHGYGPAEHESVKTDYGITADEPVEMAVRQMSLQMLRVARQNEQGVIDDIDSEFLHQYRVSLRKVRSLLNLMKNALPVETHLRLKLLLSELSGITNLLRDLDVFLLGQADYQALLPDNFDAGLSKLFQLIANDREKARKVVKQNFETDKHAAAFNEVIALLEGKPAFESELASQPVIKVARKKILNRYRRIGLVGAEIHEGTPDEDVHALRIECKKLRYLIEFFAELFPQKDIRKILKALKTLQTILGNFNDYSVQKIFLSQYEKNHRKTAELSAAINGLVAVLHQKQLAERMKVKQAFAAFNDRKVAANFEKLFGKEKVEEQ